MLTGQPCVIARADATSRVLCMSTAGKLKPFVACKLGAACIVPSTVYRVLVEKLIDTVHPCEGHKCASIVYCQLHSA